MWHSTVLPNNSNVKLNLKFNREQYYQLRSEIFQLSYHNGGFGDTTK